MNQLTKGISSGIPPNIGNIGAFASKVSGLLPTGGQDQTTPDGALYVLKGTAPNETIDYTPKNTDNYKKYIDYKLDELYIKPLDELGDQFEIIMCKNIDSYLEEFQVPVSQAFSKTIEEMLDETIGAYKNLGSQTGGDQLTVGEKKDIMNEVALKIEEVSNGIILKNTSVSVMRDVLFEKLREKINSYFKNETNRKKFTEMIRNKIETQKGVFLGYFADDDTTKMDGGAGIDVPGILTRGGAGILDLTKITSGLPKMPGDLPKTTPEDIATPEDPATSEDPATTNLPDVYLSDPALLNQEILNYIAEKIFGTLETKIKTCENSIIQKLVPLFLNKITEYILHDDIMNILIEHDTHKKLFDPIIAAPNTQLKYLYSLFFKKNKRDDNRVKRIVDRLNHELKNFDMNIADNVSVKLDIGLEKIQNKVYHLFLDPSTNDMPPSLDKSNPDKPRDVPDLTIKSEYNEKANYEPIRNILDFAYDKNDTEKLVLFKGDSIKTPEGTPVTTLYDKVIQIFEGVLSGANSEFEKTMEDTFKKYIDSLYHIDSLYQNFKENKLPRYYDLVLSNIYVVNFLQAVVLDCIDKYNKYRSSLNNSVKDPDNDKLVIFILYGIYYALHKYVYNSYGLHTRDDVPIVGDTHIFYAMEGNQPTFYVNIDTIFDGITSADWDTFLSLIIVDGDTSSYRPFIERIIKKTPTPPTPPAKKGGRKSRRNTKQYTSKKRQYRQKYTQYRRVAKTIKRRYTNKK